MPNWIDEAKKQAEDKIEMFHKLTETTRLEIEQVLETAKQQGLKVECLGEDIRRISNPHIGGNGNLLYRVGFAGSPEGYCTHWIVKSPSGRWLNIYLGIDMFLESKEPTTSSIKVQDGIKAWLVQIFSEQK